MKLTSATGAVALAFCAASAVPAAAHAQTSDPYARYTTPGQCEQAGKRLAFEFWRARRQDTVVYKPDTDSIPAAAINGIKACLSRFSIEKAGEWELLDLGQAYLIAQQDELAAAAFTKLLASPAQKDPVRRGWTIQLIADSYLDAKPSRVSEADKYLAMLDGMGDQVALWRFMAHAGRGEYAMSVNDIAKSTTEYQASLAASAKMVRNDRLDFAGALLGTYAAYAEPVVHTLGKDAALAVFDTAARDVFPLRPEGSQELAGLKNAHSAQRNPYTLFGERSLPLKANQWFEAELAADGMGMGAPTYPKPGRVTVILFTTPNCGAACFLQYATIRRLQAKYGEQGVDVVFATQLSGYFRNKLSTAEDEPGLTAKYFQEYLELPVTIAAENREFSKKHDGRLIRPPTENMQNYIKSRSIVIVGRDGVVRASSRFEPLPSFDARKREMAWGTIIEKALQN